MTDLLPTLQEFYREKLTAVLRRGDRWLTATQRTSVFNRWWRPLLFAEADIAADPDLTVTPVAGGPVPVAEDQE